MDELYRHLARRLLRYWHIFHDALAALKVRYGVSSSTVTPRDRQDQHRSFTKKRSRGGPCPLPVNGSRIPSDLAI